LVANGTAGGIKFALMNYWLDLFTGRTYEQFKEAGAGISGFRQRKRATVSQVTPGDILLCYLTGVMRWVGALEVVGQTSDKSRIWDEDFPARLAVKPILLLDPEHGVPMDQFEAKLSFYSGPKDRGKFKGFVRGSPNKFRTFGLMCGYGERFASPQQQPAQRAQWG
jgi:hypothetical protein